MKMQYIDIVYFLFSEEKKSKKHEKVLAKGAGFP